MQTLCVLSTRVFMFHAHAVPFKSRRAHRFLGSRVTDGCEPSHRSSGRAVSASALTSKPSPQLEYRLL